jgi:chemotaxis protein methyltransferase CheR
MSPQTVDEIEARLVLDAIFERYGYDFRDYEPGSINRRLRATLQRHELAHHAELLHRVLTSEEFFIEVLNDLMIQVSEMFRDPPSYRVFRERVVPILRTYPEIRVWHAGCASGEEAYATAILLSESDLYERSQIYATDLSSAAIARAQSGVYGETEARAFARNYLAAGGNRDFSEYCTSAYGRVIMRESLRRNLVFFQHDLASDYALGEMHVVFCRNVLIYFNPPLRQRALGIFAAGLCRGGFLCLGAGDGIPAGQSEFESFERRAHIYRRVGEA